MFQLKDGVVTGRKNRKVLKTLGTDSGFEFGVCPRNYLLLAIVVQMAGRRRARDAGDRA